MNTMWQCFNFDSFEIGKDMIDDQVGWVGLQTQCEI